MRQQQTTPLEISLIILLTFLSILIILVTLISLIANNPHYTTGSLSLPGWKVASNIGWNYVRAQKERGKKEGGGRGRKMKVKVIK